MVIIVLCCRGVHPRGSPEQWLASLEKALSQTVARLLQSAVDSYDSLSRAEWALQHPGQVVLTAVRVMLPYHIFELVFSAHNVL